MALPRSMEKQAPPSPSRSQSFSRGGWLIRSSKQARVAPSLELERLDVDACLGESFSSSTASFIDMDPAELFSMRWTSDDASLPPLVASGGDLFLPCELPSGGIGRVDVDDGGVAYADVVSTSASSPAVFHSAQSMPATAPSGGSRRSSPGARPLVATRRLLLRYLRFLAPLCRKARSLAPRSGTGRALADATTTTPARRSTSSVASVAEHWCHGNADTAVRDAILYCNKSFKARAEC